MDAIFYLCAQSVHDNTNNKCFLMLSASGTPNKLDA